MSLTDIFRPGTGSRRAVAEVDRLREENRLLLSQKFAADDRIAVLEDALATARRQHLEDQEIAVTQQRDNDKLQAKCDDLTEQLAALHRRFGKELADEANAAAVTVPAWERDTTAIEDRATAPLDVRPLWTALGVQPNTA